MAVFYPLISSFYGAGGKNMKQKDIEAIALLRYRIILPVLNEEYPDASANKYFERIATQEVLFPDGNKRIIRPSTAKMWLNNYRKHGFEGLKDKSRNDRGKSRTLSKAQKELIEQLKTERPRRTATSIYKQLVREGILLQQEASLSTVQRYIAKIKPYINGLTTEDMRAFEMEYANDLWQIDTSHGPYLTIKGKKIKTYMIMIVDDASRMIVGHGIFTHDNSLNVQLVFKDALKKYGIPKRLYTDNGTPYRNKQLDIIAAKLGVGLKRAQVYHGNQKGKVERNFRSVKEGWMYDLDYNDFDSCESLNASLALYVQEKNQSQHASLTTSPWLRYLQDQAHLRRGSPEFIDNAFLHTAQRRVNNDATIQLENKLYEASQEYIGQKIILKYQPDFSKVYLYDKEKYIALKEVNKVENSRIKRNQPLLSSMEDKF